MKKEWRALLKALLFSSFAVLLFGLRVDGVVVPWLMEYGLQGQKLFGVASIAATLELLYWYWYAGWAYGYLAKKPAESRLTRLVRRMDPRKNENVFARRVAKWSCGLSWSKAALVMGGLGFIPTLGWMAGFAVSRARKSRVVLIPLLATNPVKVLFLGHVYSYFPWPVRYGIIITLVLFLPAIYRRLRRQNGYD